MVRESVDYAPEPGRMRRRRVHATSTDPSDPRETSGPLIDGIPSTRSSWWDRQYRGLKKLFFSPPSKSPIAHWSLWTRMFTLVSQQQLGSGAERCAYIRVDAPQQVLALSRVLVGPEMPDAVRGPRVDD